MKYFLLLLLISLSSLNVNAQNFDLHFINKTLRVDYIFSGTDSTQNIALDQLNQLPQWAGRHNNLDKLIREGNGQIIMTDLNSGICIYKDAFSTLFQEWQTTDEAKKVCRSFENTFLLPFPKNKISVEVKLRDKDGLYRTAIKHTVDPNDILIKKKGNSDTPPYTIIHKGDSSYKCVNIVILAEGYTTNEMNKFRQDAQIACEEILAHSPFNRLKNRLRFIAVETPSKDSGVSIPRNSEWKETAFNSHFDTFYSDRYLTTTNVKDIHDAIASIPYSHIIILANTDVYGGGGIFNSYTLTTTGHKDFKPVVVHEFGHSFGGLADEYYYDNPDVFDDTYPLNIEPWEPNITTLKNFSEKWKNMLLPQTPIPTPPGLADKYKTGVYEGAGYTSKGIYRPADDCRMKTNSCKDFCPVCQKAIEELIFFYTN